MQFFALAALYGLLLSALFLFHYPKAQDLDFAYCNNQTFNYTPGDAYEKNLKLALSSLAANASQTGFYFTSIGQDLDVVYGLVQCNIGISSEDCQTCVDTCATSITQQCQNQKEASIYGKNCLLEYSYWRFYSIKNSKPIVYIYNRQSVNDPVVFNYQLGSLMKNLSSSASSSPSRSAGGSANYTDFITIYALLLCTRDSTESTCLRCLQDITALVPNCCDGKQGGQIISWSCRLRFEIYSFFEMPSSPPGPPLPETNSTSISTSHDDGSGSIESLLIDLNTIKIATRNFLEAKKLGEGGFGPVYWGKLSDGREIAVKRLSSNSGQGLDELRTEVMLVAHLLHRNLVKLLGFCLEEKEKLLVYEFLPNGSLDKILFDESRRACLGWEQRYEIIIGIARGLLYLHEESQLRVIHRDLKASNILLDECMNPKISDFGLARLFHGSQTHATTIRIAGTYGYMAPEYAKTGHFSTKSDVYSFGILVLEIVTGRKLSSFHGSVNLQSYTWQNWTNGAALELLDPLLGDQWPRYEVLKCIHVALLCVQEVAAYRPTMSEIVLMLMNSYITTSLVPSRPAFFVPSRGFVSDVERKDYGRPNFDQSKQESSQQTVNDVTISELHPR